MDLTRLEREIQRCAHPEIGRALRAVLDVVRQNTGRIDALESALRDAMTSPKPPPAGATG